MTREIEYRLPDWLVYYYFHGDASSLSDDEEKRADEWYEKNVRGGTLLVDNEAFFSYYNDFDNLGNDCLECTVLFLGEG